VATSKITALGRAVMRPDGKSQRDLPRTTRLGTVTATSTADVPPTVTLVSGGSTYEARYVDSFTPSTAAVVIWQKIGVYPVVTGKLTT